MEVIVGELSGFCFGVKNAVDRANEILNNNKKIYCLGEIVHNDQVIRNLENKGMITVQNIEEVPDGQTVIFRAHGEPEYNYKIAENKNLEVIDLTCPKVKIIHDLVKSKKEKYFILIIGKKTHPEIIGIKDFAGEASFVIENEEDIFDAYLECENFGLDKVFIVSQTTFSSRKFDELSKKIEYEFADKQVLIEKTICTTTETRQTQALEIAQKVDKMIIIGGKNSSNTKELANICIGICEKVYLVETSKELNLEDFSENDKIGIMAGASTPHESIQEVKERLEKNYSKGV